MNEKNPPAVEQQEDGSTFIFANHDGVIPDDAFPLQVQEILVAARKLEAAKAALVCGHWSCVPANICRCVYGLVSLRRATQRH